MDGISVTGLIAELGGAGALVSIMVNLIQGYRQANLDRMAFERDQDRKDREQAWNQHGKMIAKTVIPEVGAWVSRVLVVTSMFIIASPVYAPLLFKDCAVTWYWPTNGSFLFFSWDKLKAFTVGPEDAARHIAILPIHISMTLNIIGYYLPNRVFKRRHYY